MAEVPETAFGSLVAALPALDSGIVVRECAGRGLATVMARAGRSKTISERLGFALSDGPLRGAHGDVALLGTGPGTWLMIVERRSPDWPRDVAADLAGFASVFDQSSGYAILRLSGIGARLLLQKGMFLDLHSDTFKAGAVAATAIEHIGVIVWCLEESVFEIAVFRSFASSLSHWLVTAAAAAGLPLRRAD